MVERMSGKRVEGECRARAKIRRYSGFFFFFLRSAYSVHNNRLISK